MYNPIDFFFMKYQHQQQYNKKVVFKTTSVNLAVKKVGYCNVIRSFPHLQKKPFPHWKYQPLLSMNFSSFTEWQFYIIWKNLHQNSTFQLNSMLKVSKSGKQILASWILPKNERNSLSWPLSVLRIVSFVHFLEELRTPYFFRYLMTFSNKYIFCILHASVLL